MINNNPQHLYELLRKLRNNIAKDAMVEPFMIFHNKVLQAIAESKPSTLEGLAKIKGMGEKKLAKYGTLILKTINNSNDKSDTNTQEEKVFSVVEYINYLNQILIPQKAIVIGEVSSLNRYEKYIFFSLHDKESDALLSCFIWKNQLDNLGIELEEGMELKVGGFPKIFERNGQLTFQVEYIGLIGEGALKLAFEKLKKKLEGKGYFDEERKKNILDYVQKIGLITSHYGDAIKDFRTHLGNFGYKINFFDIRVEGIHAIDDIVSAIRWFNESLLNLDIIVLTRGGGSLESLQPFNSETVAKAILSSRIPIITGIGHENDITIADLVADKRASTPTDAARILSDSWRNTFTLITAAQKSMLSLISLKIKECKVQISNNNSNLIIHIEGILKLKKQKLDEFQNLLWSQFKNLLIETKDIQTMFMNNWEILNHKLHILTTGVQSHEHFLLFALNQWFGSVIKNLINLEEKLQLSSPETRLKHGYSIITNIDNKVVKSVKQIKLGDDLSLKFYQGSATSKIERIEE